MDREDQRRDAPVARSQWRHGRDLVFDVDRDGTLLDATPSARAWLGGPDVGLLDAVHPHDAAALLRLLAGEPPEGVELRFANVPPAAGYRTVEINATTPTA